MNYELWIMNYELWNACRRDDVEIVEYGWKVVWNIAISLYNIYLLFNDDDKYHVASLDVGCQFRKLKF